MAWHPSGQLIATLQSEQGATTVLFATGEGGPTPMRLRRRALILDCDGYEVPEFTPDGRYLAVRGDAYGNSVSVFEFPSLTKVLAMPLGEPRPNGPGFPSSEWIEQMRAWSRYAMVFGRQSGALWIGTPTGMLMEIDLQAGRVVEHDVLTGARVTAIGALATGGLVIAGGGGELLLASEPPGCSTGEGSDTAAAYLTSTSVVPEDGALEPHLIERGHTTTCQR